jgi:hypothetical protein
MPLPALRVPGKMPGFDPNLQEKYHLCVEQNPASGVVERSYNSHIHGSMG